MRMKVGDEECMMGYTHAARYETVISNAVAGDVASGKALRHSKTRGKMDGAPTAMLIPARWRPATWQR